MLLRSAPIITLSLAISKSGMRNDLFVETSRVERRFVDDIREVGTGKSGRSAGDDADIDVFVERDLSRVNFKNALAAANIRTADDNAAVKTSGPKKCRIENVGPVGRGHQNDAVVRFKTVHFDQKLVQRLLAFVVTAAEAGTAMTADSVDLVDKDDARGVLFALLEKITNTARTDADEHLDKIRTRDREERNIRFTGNSFCKQCLARSRRAHHQNALRDLAAELLKLLRVFEKFDYFLQLFLWPRRHRRRP